MAETVICPTCLGADSLGHVHQKVLEYNNLEEFNTEAKVVAEVIQDLHEKYPKAVTFCPVCGAKL